MNDEGCVLIDLEGYSLSPEDRELLMHPVCAGIILFARNFQNPPQLKQLTAAIKHINPNAIIATDHEGGRVQRFREGFSILPPMSHWGTVFEHDPQLCLLQLSQMMHTMASEILSVGVNLNLIPVLDLNYQINEAIGERSFHRDINIVTELARLVITELHRHGLPAVGKHFPGHGFVPADSHYALPIDERNWNELWQKDLRPYVALSSQLDAIMPAHIVFSAMDNKPVGFSTFWLQEVLRNQLNFQGVIISDDLTMAAAATRGSYADRGLEAFQAGCDLLLVCNNRAGAIDVLSALLPLDRRISASRIARLV